MFVKLFAKGLKGLVLSCTLFASVLPVSVTTYAAAPPPDVKVQVNDNLVHFPDAQPYLNDRHVTMVPVRFVTEKLGYQINWKISDGQVFVTLSGSKQQLHIETGRSAASVNGRSNDMGAEAVFKNGRVYVPLRFISETADIRVQWDHNNYIAILDQDGKYHGPAWYVPKQEQQVFQATAYSGSQNENGGYGAVDYFGNPLQVGTVAVDPNVIPLGSTLYIEGYNFDGLPVGGMFAKATDIGGAINGRHIDIFIPGSRDQVQQFGIQQVKVMTLPQ